MVSVHGEPVEPSFDQLRMIMVSVHGELVEPSFDQLRMIMVSVHGELVEPSFDQLRINTKTLPSIACRSRLRSDALDEFAAACALASEPADESANSFACSPGHTRSKRVTRSRACRV